VFANPPVATTCHKAMHKAAGSLAAAMQHHIYHEQKGLEPLSRIPA